LGGAAAAGAVGLAAAWNPEVSIGTILIALIAAGGSWILLSGLGGAVLVGLYWIAFAVYQTVFLGTGIEFSGFFYPFYAGFVLSFLVGLFRGRIVVDLRIVVPYLVFLLLILYSFVGYTRPIDFFFVQRVLATLLGLVSMVQITSRRGLIPVVAGAVAASTIVSAWVVLSAAEAGFSYRGDIDVNQNFAAFVIGLGVVSAVALLAGPWRANVGKVLSIVLTVCVAGMLYASLLLASRGMTIALVIALGVVMLRSIIVDRGALVWVLGILLLGAAGTMLPGGDGLLERFEDQTASSGGSRVPLWTHTLDEYTDSGALELILGNGFKSSEPVIESQFGIMTSVHNSYVQMLYELGVAGLGVFFVLHAAVAVIAWRSRSVSGLISLGIICFLLGSNLTADSTDGFLYWTAFGGAAVLATWSAIGQKRSSSFVSEWPE